MLFCGGLCGRLIHVFHVAKDWPKVWKANLKKNPEDPALVSGLVNYMLR